MGLYNSGKFSEIMFIFHDIIKIEEYRRTEPQEKINELKDLGIDFITEYMVNNDYFNKMGKLFGLIVDYSEPVDVADKKILAYVSAQICSKHINNGYYDCKSMAYIKPKTLNINELYEVFINNPENLHDTVLSLSFYKLLLCYFRVPTFCNKTGLDIRGVMIRFHNKFNEVILQSNDLYI